MPKKEWNTDVKNTLDKYRNEQYQKAFAKGTTKAWRNYYATVNNRINDIEREYDVKINREIFFSI